MCVSFLLKIKGKPKNLINISTLDVASQENTWPRMKWRRIKRFQGNKNRAPLILPVKKMNENANEQEKTSGLLRFNWPLTCIEKFDPMRIMK